MPGEEPRPAFVRRRSSPSQPPTAQELGSTAWSSLAQPSPSRLSSWALKYPCKIMFLFFGFSERKGRESFLGEV